MLLQSDVFAAEFFLLNFKLLCLLLVFMAFIPFLLLLLMQAEFKATNLVFDVFIVFFALPTFENLAL